MAKAITARLVSAVWRKVHSRQSEFRESMVVFANEEGYCDYDKKKSTRY